MKFPLFIASGQGLLPFLFLGIPAAVIGLICLIVAGFLAVKKKEEDKMSVRWLSVSGVLLIAFLFVSPTLDRPMDWLLDRLMSQK